MRAKYRTDDTTFHVEFFDGSLEVASSLAAQYSDLITVMHDAKGEYDGGIKVKTPECMAECYDDTYLVFDNNDTVVRAWQPRAFKKHYRPCED